MMEREEEFVRCAGCGMRFWVGDGKFDRKSAEKKHRYYAGNHTFEPKWVGVRV